MEGSGEGILKREPVIGFKLIRIDDILKLVKGQQLEAALEKIRTAERELHSTDFGSRLSKIGEITKVIAAVKFEQRKFQEKFQRETSHMDPEMAERVRQMLAPLLSKVFDEEIDALKKIKEKLSQPKV